MNEGDCPKMERRPQIREALDDLHQSTQELHNLAEELEKRLLFASQPVAPCETGKNNPEQYCELAGTIQAERDAVCQANLVLSDILRRLEF